MTLGSMGSPLICPGLVAQLVTRNAMGAVDGSLYMVIARADTPADNTGRFLECRFAGSSEPMHGPIMEALFPSPAAAGYAYGVLHLCTQQAGSCTARLANRQVVHANQFRLRRASTVVDPWKRDLYALGASPDAPALPGVPVAGWTLPPPPGDSTPGGASAADDGWDLSALDMSSSNDDDASTSKKAKRKTLKLKAKLLKKKIQKAKSPAERATFAATAEELAKKIRSWKKKKKKKTRKSPRKRTRRQRKRRRSMPLRLLAPQEFLPLKLIVTRALF